MSKVSFIKTTLFLLLIVCATLAMATERGDRSLFLNDTSFENGLCGEGSGWTCGTDTGCPNWIIDPTSIWGVPANDGTFVAQLGGLCGEELSSNTFCQEVDFGWPCTFWLTWSWMGIVNGANPGSFRVTQDGVEIEAYEPSGVVVDSNGVWETGYVSIWAWGETSTFCFEFDAGSDESAMLIDSVSNLISPTPTVPLSFSVVKSLY
ncbi:MAG: hypothetical protein GY835_25305 [bacterium]|nr:hypothetical protein [bacterium]